MPQSLVSLGVVGAVAVELDPSLPVDARGAVTEQP
jgi:hypothetical protein